MSWIQFLFAAAVLTLAIVLGLGFGLFDRLNREHQEWLDSEEGKAYQREQARKAEWKRKVSED